MMFSEKRTNPPNDRKEAINNKSTRTIVIVATAVGQNKAHDPRSREQYCEASCQLGARKTRISAKTGPFKGEKSQGPLSVGALPLLKNPPSCHMLGKTV